MKMWPSKHSHLRAQLSTYIDNQLDDRKARTLEQHLQGCHACAARLEELRAVQATLRGLPRQQAPHSFALNASQLREAQRPARRAAASYPPALGLASAAIALVLAVVITADLSGISDNGGGQPSADSAASEQTGDRQAATEPAPTSAPTAAGAAPPGQPEPGEPTPAPEARIPAIDAPQEVGEQDGGLDTVRILEIALAAGLAALLIAGGVVVINGSKRA